MRQVGLAELEYVIAATLRSTPASYLKGLAHHSREERDRAAVLIAGRIVAKFSRYEVLTSAPAAPDATFTAPVARMLGDRVGSGAPVEDATS